MNQQASHNSKGMISEEDSKDGVNLSEYNPKNGVESPEILKIEVRFAMYKLKRNK